MSFNIIGYTYLKTEANAMGEKVIRYSILKNFEIQKKQNFTIHKKKLKW